MLIPAGLGQVAPQAAQPQNRQQSWWDWFFRGGPKPGSPVREVGILSTKPTAAAQRSQFDSYAQARNSAWGDEAYDAAADEDINPMAPQGSDAASLVGLGQTTPVDSNPIAKIEKTLPPVDPPKPAADTGKGLRILGGSVLLGTGLALLVHGLKPEPKRFNQRRRNG